MPRDEKCLARRERNSIALIFHSRKLPLTVIGSFPVQKVREQKEKKRRSAKNSISRGNSTPFYSTPNCFRRAFKRSLFFNLSLAFISNNITIAYHFECTYIYRMSLSRTGNSLLNSGSNFSQREYFH